MANKPENVKSDLSRAFSEDGHLKTHVGGQALLEGIMMRGKLNWAVAVRQADGSVYLEEHELASGKQKNAWTRKPLVRGCVALVESMGLGFKALELAANKAFNKDDYSFGMYVEEAEKALAKGEDPEPEMARALAVQNGEADFEYVLADEDEVAQTEDTAEVYEADVEGVTSVNLEPKPFSWKDDFGNPDEMVDALGAQRTLEVMCEPDLSGLDVPASVDDDSSKKDKKDEGGFGQIEMAVSMVLGIGLALVLFMVAPAAITNLLVGEYDTNPIVWNILDGVLRVAVFVLYMWLIGRMKDIKRMFAYHGAEHKTIHCFEHGLDLTVENARRFPCLHVRCGTAFLIMVLVIAILVYTIIPVNLLIAALGVPEGLPKLALVIATRIIFLPIIAGVSYEITVKWAGSRPDNPLVKVILWPGMQMQRLTTNEPDDRQLECAIAAMKLVLEREEREAVQASA